MIVVPAFAHRKGCQEPVVARIVARDVAFLSPYVGERVDAEGGVIHQYGTPEEPDNKARPSADQQAENGKNDRGHPFVPVQPHQFRIAREVGNLHEVGRVVPGGEDPPDMAVQETLVTGRMDVLYSVGMQMMVPVLCGPPQHTALRGTLRQGGKHKLSGAAGRVGAMREVSVISGPNGENSQPVKRDADRNRLP